GDRQGGAWRVPLLTLQPRWHAARIGEDEMRALEPLRLEAARFDAQVAREHPLSGQVLDRDDELRHVTCRAALGKALVHGGPAAPRGETLDAPCVLGRVRGRRLRRSGRAEGRRGEAEPEGALADVHRWALRARWANRERRGPTEG